MVGLDTFAHVAKTMEDALPDDPWHCYFTLPEWLIALINEGKLGAKTGGGIYQRVKGKPLFGILIPSSMWKVSAKLIEK